MDLLHSNDRQGEYPPSLYAANITESKSRPRLEGTQNQFDICVVGAGFTGLSSALHLAKRGYKVAIIEAHRIGWGASGRNGGQVGSGQRRDQDFLEKTYGLQPAKLLWQLAQEAKSLVRELIDEYSIDCGPVDGIIEAVHKKSWLDEVNQYTDKLNNEYDYSQIRNIDIDEMRSLVKSEAYYGGAIDQGAFSIDPLAYSLGLADACEKAGVTIFENSQVTHIASGKKVRVETGQGLVQANYLVLACNGYLGDLEKQIAARVMPINNYVVASEPLSEAKAQSIMPTKSAVADSKFVVNYFRMNKNKNDKNMRMIFGGGENYGYRFPKDIKKFVARPMLQIFPQMHDVRIDYGWGGTLAITMKRLPHFTRAAGNIISCSGYSGQGVALATLAGKLVGEAIAGQAERFDLMANLDIGPFPGGSRFRYPILTLAMSWYALRDRF